MISLFLNRPRGDNHRTEELIEKRVVEYYQEQESARQRQEAFCLRWTQRQPKAVETLCRDFADTLAFYDVLAWASTQGHDWPVTWLRTTSPLERVNRSYRRKLRQTVIAHSETGLHAVLYQATIRIQHAPQGDPQRWAGFIEQLLWDS